jgi:hypothetical protein
MSTRVCIHCDEEKPETMFSFNGQGRRCNVCRACKTAREAERTKSRGFDPIVNALCRRFLAQPRTRYT